MFVWWALIGNDLSFKIYLHLGNFYLAVKVTRECLIVKMSQVQLIYRIKICAVHNLWEPSKWMSTACVWCALIRITTILPTYSQHIQTHVQVRTQYVPLPWTVRRDSYEGRSASTPDRRSRSPLVRRRSVESSTSSESPLTREGLSEQTCKPLARERLTWVWLDFVLVQGLCECL